MKEANKKNEKKNRRRFLFKLAKWLNIADRVSFACDHTTKIPPSTKTNTPILLFLQRVSSFLIVDSKYTHKLSCASTGKLNYYAKCRDDRFVYTCLHMASNQAKETDKTMKINKGKRMPKIAGAFEKEEEMATKNINKS